MNSLVFTRRHSGFTVLELVTVISILGIVVSLLLVGINVVRESARRTKCTNNLKQIGLGLLNYESAYHVFPRGCAQQTHGPLVCILPYIEQESLFATIDFSTDMDGNLIAKKARVDLFRCPSTLLQELGGRTDYTLNRGNTLAMLRNDPWFFDEKFFPRTSNFSKGSSGTPLFSETCPRVEGVEKGSMLELDRRNILSNDDSKHFETECAGSALNVARSRIDNGRFWYGGGTANYFHIFTPNSRSCSNGNLVQFSLYTATSMHSGGVNILFADGRVVFTSDGVDNLTWQSLGAR